MLTERLKQLCRKMTFSQVKNILRTIKDIAFTVYFQTIRSAENSSDNAETERELDILKQARVKIEELLKNSPKKRKRKFSGVLGA